jgi:hypothetical protein
VLGRGQPAHFPGPLLKRLGLLGPARGQSGPLARSAAARRWTKKQRGIRVEHRRRTGDLLGNSKSVGTTVNMGRRRGGGKEGA